MLLSVAAHIFDLILLDDFIDSLQKTYKMIRKSFRKYKSSMQFDQTFFEKTYRLMKKRAINAPFGRCAYIKQTKNL